MGNTHPRGCPGPLDPCHHYLSILPVSPPLSLPNTVTFAREGATGQPRSDRSRSIIIRHESPTHPAPSSRATLRPGAPSRDHRPPCSGTVGALRTGGGPRVGWECPEDLGWSLAHADRRHPARVGGGGRTMGQVRGRGAAGKGGGKVAVRRGIRDRDPGRTHSRFFWSAPPQLQASTCYWISPCSAAAAPAPRARPAWGAQRERLGRAGAHGGRQAGLGRSGAAPLSGRARASRARGSGELCDRGWRLEGSRGTGGEGQASEVQAATARSCAGLGAAAASTR